MSYKLEFFSDAWKEWEKLDAILNITGFAKLLQHVYHGREYLPYMD